MAVKYLCSLCDDLLRDAVQPSCGHRMCETCAQGLFQAANDESEPPRCPRKDCGEELVKSLGRDYFPDLFMRNEIQKLHVTENPLDNWNLRRPKSLVDLVVYMYSEIRSYIVQGPPAACGDHHIRLPHLGMITQDSPEEEHESHESQDKTLIPNTGEAKQSRSFRWVDLRKFPRTNEPTPPNWKSFITVACSPGGTLVAIGGTAKGAVVGAMGRAGGGAWGGAWGGLQFDQQEEKEEWAESHQVELPLRQVLEEVNGLLKSELAESKKNIVALQMAVADLEEQLQTKTAELERMDGQILAALMG